MIISGNFRKYDYGMILNLIRYGSLSPPDYIIENIQAPVGLFYSANDWLSAVVVSTYIHTYYVPILIIIIIVIWLQNMLV